MPPTGETPTPPGPGTQPPASSVARGAAAWWRVSLRQDPEASSRPAEQWTTDASLQDRSSPRRECVAGIFSAFPLVVISTTSDAAIAIHLPAGSTHGDRIDTWGIELRLCRHPRRCGYFIARDAIRTGSAIATQQTKALPGGSTVRQAGQEERERHDVGGLLMPLLRHRRQHTTRRG